MKNSNITFAVFVFLVGCSFPIAGDVSNDEESARDFFHQYLNYILEGEHQLAAELTCAADLERFRNIWLAEFDRSPPLSEKSPGEYFFENREHLDQLHPREAFAHWTSVMADEFDTPINGQEPKFLIKKLYKDQTNPELWHAIIEWQNVDDIRVFLNALTIRYHENSFCAVIPDSFTKMLR